MNPYRKDFPILKRKINGKSLVYLDNAATVQKPQSVIDAIEQYYMSYNSNTHSPIHTMSQEAASKIDETKKTIAKLIGTVDVSEIIFTSGTTAGINQIAYGWAEHKLKPGDEILLSIMEHHANIVPWLELSKRKKIKLKFIPLTKKFELDYTAMKKLITKKTKLVSLVHISNVLGIKNDVEKIVSMSKKVGARVHIDAAQSIAREKINVSNWNIDFLTFSGHKMYGPTGIGVLYVNKKIFNELHPFVTGGGMIMEVTQNKVRYHSGPKGHEAGTLHIAGIVGLGAAAKYIMDIGVLKFKKNEHEIASYAYDKLSKTPNITIYGNRNTNGIISFTVKGIHPHDIAEIMNRDGIAIRAGHHCTMPLHKYLGVAATARISLACYNTKTEIDSAITALKKAKKLFA